MPQTETSSQKSLKNHQSTSQPFKGSHHTEPVMFSSRWRCLKFTESRAVVIGCICTCQTRQCWDQDTRIAEKWGFSLDFKVSRQQGQVPIHAWQVEGVELSQRVQVPTSDICPDIRKYNKILQDTAAWLFCRTDTVWKCRCENRWPMVIYGDSWTDWLYDVVNLYNYRLRIATHNMMLSKKTSTAVHPSKPLIEW